MEIAFLIPTITFVTPAKAGVQESSLKWKRAWKKELIEKNNPLWRDLYEQHLPWIPDQVRKDGGEGVKRCLEGRETDARNLSSF